MADDSLSAGDRRGGWRMAVLICTTFAHIFKTCIKKGVFYTYSSIDVRC